MADNVTHLITELRDDMGRSVGYTYAKNGSVQQTVSTGYGTDGRIASAGFVHGGAVKQFGYAYLNGTNLLQTLTMPNNMSLTQSFEEKRDLLTQMNYKRGATLVTRRQYTYDTLARPLTRTTSRQGQTINDSFVHTYRSELASAQVNGETYGYDYDNIGNRRMAMEASDYAFYEANNLNQYSSIQRNEEEAFVPNFDADGNQTLVRTATGIWSVSYNAENRPVIFQKTTDSVTTRITCSYDSMGRRATKKVEEITTDAEGNETSTLVSNHRFIYRGYLQIACCDLTRTAHPCLWLITWDPTQPVATRPLAIQKDGTWFCYGWDLTKNICEVFGQNGYIRTAYSYTPYGSVTANGDITQPIQWSSEYDDTELALTYYNFRHYNPMDGRWLGRDLMEEYRQSLTRYSYTDNNSLWRIDNLGNSWLSGTIDLMWETTTTIVKETTKYIKGSVETFEKVNKEYKIVARMQGLVTMFLGTVESAVGGGLLYAPEPTTATKIIGYSLFCHGADVTVTGFKTVIYGEAESTMLNKSIKNVAIKSGIDTNRAEYIASGSEIGFAIAMGRIPIGTKICECSTPILITTQAVTKNSKFVQVTRWGPPLENKNWVMIGKPHVLNYIASGKLQPGMGNIYTPPWKFNTYMVPKENLKCPRSTIKKILGQRIYIEKLPDK